MGQMSDAPSGNLFGGSQGLFGSAPVNPFASPSPAPSPAPASAVSSATQDLASLSISPDLTSSTSLTPPHPAYWPAQYLSTTDEYLPPPDEVEYDSEDESESAEQKAEWRDERFQQMLTKGIDPLFERFVRRLADADGASEQVLRYAFAFWLSLICQGSSTPAPMSER